MTQVKICGVTEPADATMAVEAGADLLGLNLWPGSKRYLDLDQACAVAAAARATHARVALVGVLVDPEPPRVAAVLAALDLDYVQLHGDESPALCAAIAAPVIKALAIRGPGDLARIAAYHGCAAVLLDSASPGRGGSGQPFDWRWADSLATGSRRFILAGGLNPDNVAAAIATVGPWAVDVASGVERAPGRKDPDLVRRFVAAAKGRP